jgi:hypothetical protein
MAMMRWASSVGSIAAARAAAGKVFDAAGLVRMIDGRRLVGDEGAAGGLDGEGASSREGVVGVADGVEVDLESDRDLSHRGHFLPGFQDAGADRAEDLVPDLDVDRDAGGFDVD